MHSHNNINRPWYKQKRWYLALTVTLVVILLITAWTTRSRHSIKLAAPYLQPYQLTITCLDWSLNWEDSWKNALGFNLTADSKQSLLNQPNVQIEQLCLSHPHGDISINNLVIDNIKAPNVVFIGNIQIKANKPLGVLINQLVENTAKPNEPLTQSKLLQQIHLLVSQAKIPLNLALGQLSLSAPNLNAPVTITGSQSTQALILQISQQQQTIDLNIDYFNQSAQLNTNIHLNELINTLNQQQITLPPALKQVNLKGKITAGIHYKEQSLNIKYQANNMQANVNKLSISLPSNTKGMLTLSDKNIHWKNGSEPTDITFNQGINTHINQRIENLAKNQQQAIKQLLQANPITNITLTLPEKSAINLNQNNLALTELTISLNNQLLSVTISDIQHQRLNNTFNLNLDAKSTLLLPQISQITKQPIKTSITGTISGQLAGQNSKISLSKNSHITVNSKQIKHPQISAQQLNLAITGPVQWQNNTLKSDISATLNFNSVKHPKLATIESLHINTTSKLVGPLNALQYDSHNQVSLNQKPLVAISTNGPLLTPKLTVKSNDISLFELSELIDQSALKAADIELPKLVSGTLSFALNSKVKDIKQPLNNTIKGQFALKDLSGEHQDTWFEQLNYQQNITIKNGQLTTDNKNNLTISKIESGTDLTDINAQVNYQLNLTPKDIQPRFSLNVENVSTQAFGGQFSFEQFNWPKLDTINLTLNAVDLAKIVALEKQQGIIVTGLISGVLPTTLTKAKNKDSDKWTVTIDHGDIHNITDGVIQIKDNPAVKRLKNSRDDLKLAFDALQNLHYHQLTSKVTMSDDGQMYLETVIKGVNPELDNEVNFNLNLDYDLLGLLQSALISKNVEQQVNDSLKQ